MTDFFTKAGNLLATSAPELATLFGGPLAGNLVAGIENILDIKPSADATLDQRKLAAATAMLTATPDQLLRLRELGVATQKQLLDAGVSLEQLDTGDRASARARQVALKDYLPGFLAITVTFGFFGLLGLLAYHEIPTGSGDIEKIMLGALGTGWGSIIGYYFGSSSGSARAQELLAKTGPVTE